MVSRAFIGSWSGFASERFGNRNERVEKVSLS